MAVGDLVTSYWDLEFNGLAFGGETDFGVTSITGLAGMPNIQPSDRPRLLRDGLYAGQDFLLERRVAMTVEVFGSDVSAFSTNLQAFNLAMAPGGAEKPLVMYVPGMCNNNKFMLWARPRRRVVPVDRLWFYNVPVMNIEFVATDPRLYSLAQYSQALTLPQALGGAQFDMTFDLQFGGGVAGGDEILNNAGTYKTSPVFKIIGPVINPALENITTGKKFKMDITVLAGDYLIVDMSQRTVMLNGTASRYSNVVKTSEFWDLEPGDNTVVYSAAGYTVSTATATWRDAWV